MPLICISQVATRCHIVKEEEEGEGEDGPPPLSLVFEYMEGDSFPPFYWGGGGETDKNLESQLRGGAVWATELSRVWCRLKGAGLIINPSIHVRRTVGRGGGGKREVTPPY